MFKKPEYKILKERLEEKRTRIQVISGPRQVGKSTMVKQVLTDITIPYEYVTADNVSPDNNTWINEVWESVRARMVFNKLHEYILVIDEVHKIDNWSEAIKREWDMDTFNDTDIKVVLLGSSRLLLKDGLTESLAGRYEIIHMTHWTFREMHEAFATDINQYIYFGGYPGGATLMNDERRWKSYIKESIIAPAIKKDILMTKNIFKPNLMQQLFELGCVYSGEELSLNKILGQLQDAGNVTTLANYLTTLDESRLLAGLYKYASDNARKYNSIPKFMTYNTALLTAQSGMTFKEVFTTPKLWGRWVESCVGAYLLNMADRMDFKTFYWRERNDEVDFIIERDRKVIAIEVKSGKRQMNKGIAVFKDKFSPKMSLIVGTGGISVADFIDADIEASF